MLVEGVNERMNECIPSAFSIWMHSICLLYVAFFFPGGSECKLNVLWDNVTDLFFSREWAEPRTPLLAGAQGTGWPSCQVGVTILSSSGLSPLEGARGPRCSSGPPQCHSVCSLWCQALGQNPCHDGRDHRKAARRGHRVSLCSLVLPKHN